MTNDRRRSLSSSSLTSFAGETRSLPRARIEDDSHGAPAALLSPLVTVAVVVGVLLQCLDQKDANGRRTTFDLV